MLLRLKTREIAAHDVDTAAWKGDKKTATKVRRIEKADHVALHADYSESVAALDRATAVLKQQIVSNLRTGGI